MGMASKMVTRLTVDLTASGSICRCRTCVGDVFFRDVNAHLLDGLQDACPLAYKHNPAYDAVVAGGFHQEQIFGAFAAADDRRQGA